MTVLRCIAIDDEPLALHLLSQYATRTPQLRLLATFEDPVSAQSYLQQHPIDLVFTDIQMPDLNGINLVKQMGRKPMVIFTTAFKKFAYEGFELQAIDYLLKPYSYERFVQATEKAWQYYLHSYQQAEQAPDSIYVRSEYRMIRVALADIAYIEGLEDYIRIHLQSGQKLLTLMSLKAMMEMLPHRQFIRIHRSYIVPLRQIEVLHKRMVQLPGMSLPVSDSYLAELRKALGL